MKNWPIKKLREIALLKRGPFGGSLKKEIFVSDGYKVYEQKNAIQNDFNLGNYYVDQKKFKEMDTFKVLPGDLIVSCSGTMGRVAIAPKNIKQGIINQALLRLTPGNSIIAEYLKFILESPQIQRTAFSSTQGSAIKNVGAVKILKEVEIPVPPIEEQKRIVKKLEKILAKIEESRTLRQESITDTEKLRALNKDSVFKDLIKSGIQELTMEEITTLITDGTHYTPKYTDSGIPFLSVKNIRESGFLLDDIKHISSDEHKILTKRCKPEKDDVIYTKVGTTGIAKVIDIDMDFSIFVSLALLRVDKSRITPRYLEVALNSPYAKSQAERLTRGMANKNLVIKDIKKIKIPVPKLQEQEKIVGYLDSLSEKVQALQRLQQEQLQDLEALQQSVLHQAFQGEL